MIVLFFGMNLSQKCLMKSQKAFVQSGSSLTPKPSSTSAPGGTLDQAQAAALSGPTG